MSKGNILILFLHATLIHCYLSALLCLSYFVYLIILSFQCQLSYLEYASEPSRIVSSPDNYLVMGVVSSRDTLSSRRRQL
jgi:hypothetical protein